jgi:hypothetical protein
MLLTQSLPIHLLTCSRFVVVLAVTASSSCSPRKQESSSSQWEGVRIQLHPTQENFPRAWQSSDVRLQMVPLAKKEHQRSLHIAQRCLAKYPSEVLAGNLSEIVFVDHMSFYGLPYGGTYANQKIYISNRGASYGYTDQFLELAIHQEFSSILFNNYRHLFPEAEWRRINPHGFRYLGSGIRALKYGQDGLQFDPQLYKEGFLYQYAKASLEEDFNSIAENLFAGSKQFWQVIAKSPQLQQKVNLAIQFYHALHPRFTLEYFKSLAF